MAEILLILILRFFAALAAGSILYVVVFEILQRERSKNVRPKIAQFIAVVAGFAALMTVTLLSEYYVIQGDPSHCSIGVVYIISS